MKLALRYIPTEVWVDVVIFPWITRKELGKIVPMFRNRYFAEILQYCLHERGKRTLDTIDLTKKESIPQTPMPENITSFKFLYICDFDAQTLDFLHRISALFTTNDVNLEISHRQRDLTKIRTAFDNLAPLLHGIHSMDFDQRAIPLVQQFFGPKLPQVKMLAIDFDEYEPSIQTYINFCVDWLISDGSKLLTNKIGCPNIMPQFSQAVRKQFLSAEKPSTFAVEFICNYRPEHQYPTDQLANFHLENNIREQLDGETVDIGVDGYACFQIYRHQVGTARAKLEEWVNEKKSDYIEPSSMIRIDEIDPTDGNAGANEVNKAGDGEETNQPSTSG